MRSGKLILTVSGSLARGVEVRPTISEISALIECEIRRPFSEGFVEPQVIPPFHGCHVAEPHMCHLVQDGARAEVVLAFGHFGTEDK